MHEAHRKAAAHHQLAAQSHRTAAEHNEKGITQRQSGIPNARCSTRIKLTSLQRKPTRSQGR
jgi:hypothetical protein